MWGVNCEGHIVTSFNRDHQNRNIIQSINSIVIFQEKG